MMSLKIPCALLLLVCALKFSATQTSCKGRCGAEYYRGYMCQCDYGCLLYEECCTDYESQCTTQNSCKGRCGETFKRGRQCTCDSDCTKYKQCCPDYNANCESEDSALDEDTQELAMNKGNNEDGLFPLESSTPQPTTAPSDGDTFADIEAEVPVASPVPDITSGDGSSPSDLLDQVPTDSTVDGDVSLTQMSVSLNDDPLTTTQVPRADATDLTTPFEQMTTFPQPTVAYEFYTESLSASPTTSINTSQRPEITQNTPKDLEVLENVQVTTTSPSDVMIPTTTQVELTHSLNTEQNSNDVDTSAPSLSPRLEDSSRYSTELSIGTTIFPSPTNTMQGGTSDNVIPAVSTSDPLKDDLKTTEPSPSTSKPEEPPEPSKLKPTSEPVTKPLDTQTPNTDIQADDSNDKNLCSGRPISGVTTLRNGTIAVFRGHYFWFLDSNRVPSPPQSITQVWGVPSPIDTVFTRCNCEGKTYILKGSRYWRYDNDVLEPGYPKVIKTGFGGLRGHITAALSVPQYRSRREAVFFFKRGGFVQKYSYQAGIAQTCGRKLENPIVTVRSRSARQAVTILEPAINIRKSWKGFPIQITAAVSVPITQEQEGYKYFVFSKSSTYNVKMSGERPIIATKENALPQSNSFFKCPKKQP